MPQDLQYSLIEFIAHVNAEDYGAMPNDFVQVTLAPALALAPAPALVLAPALALAQPWPWPYPYPYPYP